MHSFDNLDASLDEHGTNVLDKRDEMLCQVRSTIVAGSEGLLSGSSFTGAIIN